VCESKVDEWGEHEVPDHGKPLKPARRHFKRAGRLGKGREARKKSSSTIDVSSGAAISRSLSVKKKLHLVILSRL
jgi:hypothetical protein